MTGSQTRSDGACGIWQVKSWLGTLFQSKAILVPAGSVSAIPIQQTSSYLQLLWKRRPQARQLLGPSPRKEDWIQIHSACKTRRSLYRTGISWNYTRRMRSILKFEFIPLSVACLLSVGWCPLSVLSVVVCMCRVLLFPAWLSVHWVRGKCCPCFSIVCCLFQCHLLFCLSSRLLCHLLRHLLISHQERLVYLGGTLSAFYSICLFCVSGDGVGCWGVSCITAISRPDRSYVRGFPNFEVLAAFVWFSWNAARGGSVTDVHDVTGLIHGHGCRGWCLLYISSFSPSLFSVP